MMLPYLRLKKGEDRRIRHGHPWIFSNEINITATPFKSFSPGQEVWVQAHDGTVIGTAYVNPHSLICARLISRDPSQSLTLDFFKQRIQSALAAREQLFTDPSYRLIFSEADGLPGLVVDRFANDLVVQINTAGMELKKELIVEALRAVLPNTHSILFRNDSAIREQEGLTKHVEAAFGEPPQEINLRENGVNFIAPLWTEQENRMVLRSPVEPRTSTSICHQSNHTGCL